MRSQDASHNYPSPSANNHQSHKAAQKLITLARIDNHESNGDRYLTLQQPTAQPLVGRDTQIYLTTRYFTFYHHAFRYHQCDIHKYKESQTWVKYWRISALTSTRVIHHRHTLHDYKNFNTLALNTVSNGKDECGNYRRSYQYAAQESFGWHYTHQETHDAGAARSRLRWRRSGVEEYIYSQCWRLESTS